MPQPRTFRAINPATGELVAEYAAATDADVERALAASESASRIWRAAPLDARLRLLARAADILDGEAQQFAALMTREMGKPVTAAAEEARKCAAACRYYAEHAARFLSDERVTDDGRVMFQPLGAVLAVMPWNFPFWQVVRFAAPALAAGNVAVLKHAANVPGCALALEDLFRRAGAPPGVFTALLLPSSRVAALIADRRIAAVTLTGSTAAGRAVAQAAGAALKKTVLELGGSDPFIVLPDADLDGAAAAAVRARTVNNGQSCIAAKRFIVHAAVYDAFLERFKAGMRDLRVGDPMDPATELGPLATRAIRDELHAQVDESVRLGARLELGGAVPAGPGNYYPATILTALAPGMPAHDDELFGPVASLFRVDSADQAIQLANGSRFGLGASVWTADVAAAERFGRELEAGSVFVNSIVASDPRFPFGGVKESGYGRELSAYGLREFTNIKTFRKTFRRASPASSDPLTE